MNTPTESDHRLNPYVRWIIYLGLAFGGIALFIACGIAGGFVTLNWLA